MSEKIESERVDLLWMEDGREAERHTKVSKHEEHDGHRTTVQELYVEKKPPKHLAKRIIEEERPVVCKRVVEHVDESGEVLERKVESLDTGVRVVDHVKRRDLAPVEMKSQEDRIDRLANVVENLALGIQSMQQDQDKVPEPEVETLSQPSRSRQFARPMQEVAEERVKSSKSLSVLNLVLAMIITAQVAGLVYITFWM